MADRQTAGRGRQGRVWQDGFGNFMGSVALRLHPGDPQAQTLALVVALAVHDAVAAVTDAGTRLCLKWPNDLLLDGAKLAGVLLEQQAGWIVVGVGVNLCQAPPLPDRPTAAISHIGVKVERDRFATTLAACFADRCAQWRSGGWPEAIISAWQARAHPMGTMLTLHDGSSGGLTGAFDGLERDGSLRLRLADGSHRMIHAGEVELTAPPCAGR